MDYQLKERNVKWRIDYKSFKENEWNERKGTGIHYIPTSVPFHIPLNTSPNVPFPILFNILISARSICFTNRASKSNRRYIYIENNR